MSGPMQWTANGLIPAGTMPRSGGEQPGAVLEEKPAVQFTQTFALKTPSTLNHPELKPKNVVALAKARLREVKAELKKLKALEKEKGELERLIAAAENKPQKSNLREIKRPA